METKKLLFPTATTVFASEYTPPIDLYILVDP
jgi:hypothetical protein